MAQVEQDLDEELKRVSKLAPTGCQKTDNFRFAVFVAIANALQLLRYVNKCQ